MAYDPDGSSEEVPVPNWEDLRLLKNFLQSSRVSELKYDYYVTYDRAVLWICYGVFADARSKAESLEHILNNWINRDQEEPATDEYASANYEKAFEQLQTAVRKGRMHLIAKYWIPSGSVLLPRGYVPPKDQYQIISAADLAEGEIEEVEGGQYTFGGHTIELLLVPYVELEQVFGSVVQNLVASASSIPRAAEPPNRIGRRRKWDWDWLYIQIILLANQPDGLPEKQAELERWAEVQFFNKYGAAPDESQIRKVIAPLYQASSR